MTKYAEIVIRYSRYMPSTSLFFLRGAIEKAVEGYTPKLQVRTEEELKP